MFGGSGAGEHCLLGGLAVRDGSSEEKDVRLWPMDHVVDPSLTLLNAQPPPLRLAHQLFLWNHLCQVLGQHDVSVEKGEGERGGVGTIE